MAFLESSCVRTVLTPSVLDCCNAFSCGNEDLDAFFRNDSVNYSRQLMGKTYAFIGAGSLRDIVCAFTVSNASIFKIQPFDFFESRALCSNFSPEQQAVLYGALWGVPEYYMHINPQKDLNANLIDLFFRPGGRLNEIATKAGLETGAASNVMSSLMELGIVRREIPATEKSSRKTVWRHFRFCRKTLAVSGGKTLERSVKKKLIYSGSPKASNSLANASGPTNWLASTL